MSSNTLHGICVACEAARRLEMPFLQEGILAGAKALHDDWRTRAEIDALRSIIKPEYLFTWDNIHPDNRNCYLRQSRIVLTAAHRAALSQPASEKE